MAQCRCLPSWLQPSLVINLPPLRQLYCKSSFLSLPMLNLARHHHLTFPFSKCSILMSQLPHLGELHSRHSLITGFGTFRHRHLARWAFHDAHRARKGHGHHLRPAQEVHPLDHQIVIQRYYKHVNLATPWAKVHVHHLSRAMDGFGL
ncbi:hypothetical protein AMTRI_Chr01g131820 [Amborella trichopoda]